ncbi:MAG: hypothetical protein ACOYKZ_08205 [Chlamydiia bacterium]
MTNPVTAAGSRPNHGYVELTERMRRVRLTSEAGPPLSSVVTIGCAGLATHLLSALLEQGGWVSGFSSGVMSLTGSLSMLGCFVNYCRAFCARRTAARTEYGRLLQQPYGRIHDAIATMTNPVADHDGVIVFRRHRRQHGVAVAAEIVFRSHRRQHQEALGDLLFNALGLVAQPTDEQFEKARSRTFQMPDGSSVVPGRVYLLPQPQSMETAYLRLALLEMDRVGDQFQVAVDSILDHAELETAPRKAKMLVESAFTLVFVFGRLQHIARATWDPDAIGDQALEQREHEEAFLVAREMRLRHSSNDLIAIDDLNDSGQCPELFSAVRCLRRTVLETMSTDMDFGLDRRSERLRSMYPEVYRGAQHRLVSHTIWDQLRENFFVNPDSAMLVNGFYNAWDVLEEEEFALRDERAAVEKVIEVLGDSDEMRAALQGPGSTQPNGLPSAPLPHLVLAGMVRRQQLADPYDQEKMDEQWKVKEVEAIQIEAIRKKKAGGSSAARR